MKNFWELPKSPPLAFGEYKNIVLFCILFCNLFLPSQEPKIFDFLPVMLFEVPSFTIIGTHFLSENLPMMLFYTPIFALKKTHLFPDVFFVKL